MARQINIIMGGRKYPCRVTLGALLAFKRKTGHDASELDMTNAEELCTLLGCCLESSCRADGVTLPEGVNADTLPDYVDASDIGELWEADSGN